MTALRVLALTLLMLLPQAARAADISGSGALALAALVGNVSPLIGPKDKDVLIKLIDGEEKFSFPMGQVIHIRADTLSCRTSNVNITEHACELSFGTAKVELTGRTAHELYATLLEVGVEPDGAAGSVYAAVKTLECEIDPQEILQNAGGGATCQYASDG